MSFGSGLIVFACSRFCSNSSFGMSVISSLRVVKISSNCCSVLFVLARISFLCFENSSRRNSGAKRLMFSWKRSSAVVLSFIRAAKRMFASTIRSVSYPL